MCNNFSITVRTSNVLNRILKKSIFASTEACPPSKFNTLIIFCSNSLEITRFPDSIFEINERSIPNLLANSCCFNFSSFLYRFKSTPLTALNLLPKNVTTLVEKCDKIIIAQSLVGHSF